MKILTNGNFIDLEAPLYMTDANRKKFIDGVKRIFKDKFASSDDITEPRKEMGEIERHPIKFSDSDLMVMADPEFSNEEVANRLKKSVFAIQMKRGNFLQEIQCWAKKKKLAKVNMKDIRRFLGERLR